VNKNFSVDILDRSQEVEIAINGTELWALINENCIHYLINCSQDNIKYL
jgi:hypothetical protein